MPATGAIPGTFLCFTAFVLLLFASLSGWSRVSFLNVGTGSNITHYGVFGPSDEPSSLGYTFHPKGLSYDSGAVNSRIMYDLTKTLVLHPIASALSFFAFMFGVCGAFTYHRTGIVFMATLSFLAALVTLVIFVIDMVLFGITRTAFRREGVPASLGNANWLTLGALFALLLGFCASTLGLFGRYRKRRDGH